MPVPHVRLRLPLAVPRPALPSIVLSALLASASAFAGEADPPARYTIDPVPPFHRVAGFSASGHLQRNDFGIDDWASLVGDTVELRIEAEARQ